MKSIEDFIGHRLGALVTNGRVGKYSQVALCVSLAFFVYYDRFRVVSYFLNERLRVQLTIILLIRDLNQFIIVIKASLIYSKDKPDTITFDSATAK